LCVMRRIFIQTDHGWDMVIHSVRAVAEAEG
jgi:hypothetical protein